MWLRFNKIGRHEEAKPKRQRIGFEVEAKEHLGGWEMCRFYLAHGFHKVTRLFSFVYRLIFRGIYANRLLNPSKAGQRHNIYDDNVSMHIGKGCAGR